MIDSPSIPFLYRICAILQAQILHFKQYMASFSDLSSDIVVIFVIRFNIVNKRDISSFVGIFNSNKE